MEPRKQVRGDLTCTFLGIIWSTSARLSDIIILDNILKICLELVKYENDNATEKFYGPSFLKVVIFGQNFENFENILEKIKILMRKAFLLYELFEREPG